MAQTEKKRIVNIDTGKSVNNVKTLKQQIKELREQMAMMEKGTKEWYDTSKRLADLNQKQIEINEAMKYSNKDLGATLSNLRNIGTGVLGAFNGISASLQIFGIAGEDADEAMKKIQLTMAVIQGMSAVDTAIKSLDGLRNAFRGVGVQQNQMKSSTDMVSGSLMEEDVELNKNSQLMKENNAVAEEYDRANRSNAKTTLESAEAIAMENKAMGGNSELLEEIAKRRAKLAGSIDKDKRAEYQQWLNELEETYNDIKKSQNIYSEEEFKKKKIKYETAIAYYKKELDALNTLSEKELILKQIREESLSLYDNDEAFVPMIQEDNFDKIEELMNALDPSDLEEGWKALEEGMRDYFEAQKQFMTEDDLEIYGNGLEDEIDSIREEYEKVSEAIRAKADASKKASKEENKALNETNKKIKANTAETEKGTKATKLFANTWKMAGNAIRSAMIASGIGAIIMLVMEGLRLMIDYIKKTREEKRLLEELNQQATQNAIDQSANVKALADSYSRLNTSEAERKVIIDELIRIYPDAIKYMNEEKTVITDLNGLLEEYNARLLERAKYEVLTEKLKEFLKQEQEAYDELDRLQKKFDYNDAKMESMAKTTDIWFGGGVRRIKHYNNELNNAQTNIKKILDEIDKLDLTKVFDTKKTETSGSSVKVVVKTLKEVVDELKKMWEDLWNTIYDERVFRRTFNGIYSEYANLVDKVSRLIKVNGMNISQSFLEEINNRFPSDFRFEVTTDLVFGEGAIQDLEKRLMEEQAKLDRMIKAGKVYKDDEIKKERETVQALKAELEADKQLLEALQAMYDYRQKEAMELEKATQAKKDYNKELELEAKLTREQRAGNAYAEVNKEIANNEYLMEQTKERIKLAQQELKMLADKGVQNKAVVDRIKELNKQLLEDQKALDKQLIDLDKAYYDKRTIDLEQYLAQQDAMIAERNAKQDAQRSKSTLGTQDYNATFDALMRDYNDIMAKMDGLRNYYTQLVLDGVMTQFEAENELQGRLIDLEIEASNKRVEIITAEMDAKLAKHNAYYNALNNIVGGVQGLLSAEMALYDENSQKYKDLAITNAWITTLSGTLSAYMSGFQSGLPAPANSVLATAMGALAFATGLAQIQALMNDSHTNATGATIGTQYETLAYATNAEVLSTLGEQNNRDNRVYVVEADITRVQNRVNVRESEATF